MMTQIIGWAAIFFFVLQFFIQNTKAFDRGNSEIRKSIWTIDNTLLLIVAAICFK